MSKNRLVKIVNVCGQQYWVCVWEQGLTEGVGNSERQPSPTALWPVWDLVWDLGGMPSAGKPREVDI